MRTLLSLLVIALVARVDAHQFSAGPDRVHLLELYTSEGCSSCPPAEAWLSELRASPAIWHEFVPVAWHVDYWDNLGWRDAFASRFATQRQYAFAAAWHGTSVYTPCFAVNGREWTNRSVPAASHDRVGSLIVSENQGILDVTFAPTQRADYDVHAILLTMNAVVNVRAGENSGKSLRHDFVATGPEQHAKLADGRAVLTLPASALAKPASHAFAVWVTFAGQDTPVQATGGLIAP